MPDWSTTATSLPLSVVMNIITLGSMHIAAKKTGPRNVVRRNDFFFTRVMVFTAYDDIDNMYVHGLFLLSYKFYENIVHPRHQFLE